MLFSRVAATLACNPDPALLLGIAGVTLAQIAFGALCGLTLAPIVGLRGALQGSGGQQQGAGAHPRRCGRR